MGVAVTDRDDKISLRHSVIDQKESDVFNVITSLTEEDEVSKILVGVPIGMSGEKTAQTRESLNFIEELKLKMGEKIVVEGIDERLTSIEAGQRIAAESGKKEDEHMEAARLMLESYLVMNR